MEGNLLDFLYKFAVVPITALCWWLFRKSDTRIEKLESRMNQVERSLDVLKSQMADIREDLARIEKGINLLLLRENKRKQ